MMARVRIAFVMDHFGTPAGGTESQLLALIRGLDRGRFEPRVYLLREPDKLSAALPDIQVRVLGIDALARPRSVARLIQFARGLKKDDTRLAHLYFNDASTSLPLLLRMARIPVIVSRRDLGYWYTFGILAALRIQRFAVEAVVANCAAVRSRVVEAEGFNPAVVHVIYNGKPLDLPAQTRAEARQSLALPPDAPVLLVVANLRPLKRVEDAVAALPLVRARFPTAELVVVGSDYDGTHAAQLRRLAASLGVESSLRIVGEVADPRPYMLAADICLLCSETEGLSNALLEYMLAERPIVATRVGGNPELIQDGRTGTLVGVGRPAEIAAAAIAYLENPVHARQVGAAARSWCAARFSLKAMVDAHTVLYESILRGNFRS
jgi:glycosyltransferase involved in cell wall biosynthesis